MIEPLLLAFTVPVGLFGFLLLLARFEANLVQPGERAAEVTELLQSSDEPEEVERATARMLAVVVPNGNRDSRRAG